jgi:hypothetical protein
MNVRIGKRGDIVSHPVRLFRVVRRQGDTTAEDRASFLHVGSRAPSYSTARCNEEGRRYVLMLE